MPTVAVVGTFDTKGEEHRFLADQIRRYGCQTLLIDVGILGPKQSAVDVSRDELAAAAGESLEALIERGDRGHAVSVMARGAAKLLGDYQQSGRIHAAVNLGGGGGTTLAAEAFLGLPIGFPKLIVSTIVAGDMRPIIKGRDLTLMYSVLDISGLNLISRRIIGNAAAAIAGMARVTPTKDADADDNGRRLVAVTAFGVTTQAALVARERLEECGYSVLVFHATGAGGESLEALIRAGFISGVLDLTTTELADDLVGGVMTAGPSRLTAAAEVGIPQVVSVGALDMVNLGPPDKVTAEFSKRRLIEHNAHMFLMRTSPAENQELGKRIADRLNASKGPAALFLPLRGVSSVAVEGMPFHDPEADAALFGAIRKHLLPSVRLIERDVDINDANFAREAADALVSQLASATKGSAGN